MAEDAKGDRLVLTDAGMTRGAGELPPAAAAAAGAFAGQTLIARFRHDLDTRKLQIKPLSIVTPTAIVRLTL